MSVCTVLTINDVQRVMPYGSIKIYDSINEYVKANWILKIP